MSIPSVGVWSLIGNTPILPLYFSDFDRTIWVKCEFLNPSGSIKDRVAVYIIEDAERRGLLKPDSIIVECSSGNTGISMAMVGVAKGYRVQILLSAGASSERSWLIRHLGGEVILIDSNADYATGIEIARKMAEADPRIFLPRQFENELNIEEHLTTTGQEILRQIDGPIGLFVNGYGTGGTLAGVGKALKRANANCKVWAMEPALPSMAEDEHPFGQQTIEGVSQGFMPDLMQFAQVDGYVKVSCREASEMTRRLSREFGLLVGTSSGANVAAALRVASEQNIDGAVVTVLCDRAERYFSTPLFQKNGLSAAELDNCK
ncbi:cysteine synthase family protein [bacterium]|nr:MAG: cysteine synthase family protein [bacterium]